MVYAEAPWVFKGRALYQLQLVKADEARKHIPSELKLVELFGYTLGGFYLARYEDSPVGAFDECVAMAGLVWNPPTSCAWAARVYVSNKEARDHGLKHVGLPSRMAAFHMGEAGGAAAAGEGGGAGVASEVAVAAAGAHWSSRNTWWNPQGEQNGEKLLARRGKQHIPVPTSSNSSSSSSRGSYLVSLFNTDRGGRGVGDGLPVCMFEMPGDLPRTGFLGPRLRLALPSFSGGTVDHPGMLEYSCDLVTNIMPVKSLKVELPVRQTNSSSSSQKQQQQQYNGEVLDALLGGKPLVTLAFSDMLMTVQEPKKLSLQAPTPAPAAAAAAAAAKQPGPLAAPLAALFSWQ